MTANTGQKATFAIRALPLIAALSCLPVGGCAVGPDFKKPAPPAVSDYTAQPLAAATAGANVEGGQVQRFAKGADISADWWTLFHSKPLDDLIAESLASNHDLKAADRKSTRLNSSH